MLTATDKALLKIGEIATEIGQIQTTLAEPGPIPEGLPCDGTEDRMLAMWYLAHTEASLNDIRYYLQRVASILQTRQSR